MTQSFKTQCNSHSASHNGKLDVTVSIRVPGDGQHDRHDDHPDHGDCHPHLPDTGVAAGSYGSATESAQFTVDAKGRLTAAGETLITPAWDSVTDKPTTLDGYGITDALPADATAVAAAQLATAHELSATGDAQWSVTFDGSADVSAPLVLADTGVKAGRYGSATTSAQVTVDAKGRVIAAESTLITPAWNSVTGKPDTLAGYGITDALPATGTAIAASKLAVAHEIAVTGDATWDVVFDGTTDVSAPLTLANTGVVAGHYGSATESAQVTVDAKGRVTAAQAAVITPDWLNVQNTPNTLAGYGITDALPANSTATAADKLTSSHTLTANGDASWNVAFDGSADVAAPLTLANTGVATGTYPKVTVDTKGRVTAGSALAAADVPALDWSKITSGKPTTRAGYGITDAAPVNNPVFTGQVTIPEGTQSSPGLTFANDGAPDTGLWHIADGSFGVTCNTTEVARFTPSGAQFSQTPTAPTAVAGTSNTQIANTAFVQGLLASVGINGSASKGAFDLNTAALGSMISVNGTESQAATYNWPLTNMNAATPVWFNVLTYGVAARTTQIATQVFAGGSQSRTWVREKHDANWSAWRENAFLDSAAFTATPTAPTPAQFDNSTKLATTGFVQRALSIQDIATSGRINAANQPNVVFNSSAEWGNAGWTGVWTPTLGANAEGTFWYAPATAGDVASCCMTSDPIPVGPGVRLAMQIEVFTAGITAGDVSADLEFHDSTGTVLGRVPFNPAGTPFTSNLSWTRYNGTATTPAPTSYFVVRFFTENYPVIPSVAAGVAVRRIKVESGISSSLYSQEATTARIASMASPPGEVAHFATPAAPLGWLKANGALVSRTTYAALFAAIGTTFGAGDGSTTFALPDLRGEFIRGLDDGRGVDGGRGLGTGQAGQTAAIPMAVGGEVEGNLTYMAAWQGPVGTRGYPIGRDVRAGETSIAYGTTGTETRPRNIALLACIKY